MDRHMPWPAPALLAWAACWVLYLGLRRIQIDASTAFIVPFALGLGMALGTQRWWRRLMVGLGFPLSLVLSGQAELPPWAWLAPLLLLLVLYPLKAWRDAPLFPTPSGALRDLAAHAPLPQGGRVLDAGCGLGHGLIALRRAYPQARLQGLEWSWPLRLLCGLRCPWAQVRQGDIWRADWSRYDVVYLFQRPESMDRAAAKAGAELAPDRWLVSLEFEVPSLRPQAVLQCDDGRNVWLYRTPFVGVTLPPAQ